MRCPNSRDFADRYGGIEHRFGPMHVLTNQATHLAWVCRNHEMRGRADRGKRCFAHALAEQRIGALHSRMTCSAANHEGRDIDGRQRRRL